MIMIRSGLFNIAFMVWTLCLGMVLFPLLFFMEGAKFVSKVWAKGTLWLLKVLCGITYRIEGREHIVDGGVIFASKHQSAFETLAFWTVLDHAVFILKRELTWIPIFGWFLVAVGSISIDRAGSTKAMRQMIKRTVSALKQNCSVIIFPEGTRSAPGKTNPYQPGVAAIYKQSQVPVIPVALNSGMCWSKNAFIKTPGVITLKFLPAIPPGMDHRAFIKQLEDIIEPETRRLEQDARAGK
jgi:1-acyl-sn-glycerol-3-phosphate acyltransferase